MWHTWLFWLPRILSLAFVLFLSVFSLDVFSEYSGQAAILPLLIHLIPSAALLVAVAIAWKYDLAGAITFCGFAVWYVWEIGWDKPWSWYAAIALPSFLVGALFLARYIRKHIPPMQKDGA